MNENEEKKQYTPAELLTLARQFRADAEGQGIAPAAPGSIIGLWLATADALADAWDQGFSAGEAEWNYSEAHYADGDNPFRAEGVSA